jgi:hypothetical protein
MPGRENQRGVGFQVQVQVVQGGWPVKGCRITNLGWAECISLGRIVVACLFPQPSPGMALPLCACLQLSLRLAVTGYPYVALLHARPNNTVSDVKTDVKTTHLLYTCLSAAVPICWPSGIADRSSSCCAVA